MLQTGGTDRFEIKKDGATDGVEFSSNEAIYINTNVNIGRAGGGLQKTLTVDNTLSVIGF